MGLDRTYQRELLEMLAQSYPRSHDIRQLFNQMDDSATERYAPTSDRHQCGSEGIAQDFLVQ